VGGTEDCVNPMLVVMLNNGLHPEKPNTMREHVQLSIVTISVNRGGLGVELWRLGGGGAGNEEPQGSNKIAPKSIRVLYTG
jgi:hypothetical protein